MTDKIKSNFHTHTLLCDGINTPEEMVIAAVDKGFDTLGFSGHCYTAYDESYCMSRENTLKYKTEIARLQEKYRGQLNILRGIEQDFGSDEPTYDYDYVIGSVHALSQMPMRIRQIISTGTIEAVVFTLTGVLKRQSAL